MKNFKNILFDFGAVLYNIDYQLTINAFKDLGFHHFENMFSQNKINSFFADFEKGQITDEEFYEILRKESPKSIKQQDIQYAWNKMLLGYRMQSFKYLEKLKDTHTLYLLSNTKSIHYRYFTTEFKNEGATRSLSSYFTQAWYSHKIGYRKPDRSCYEFILEDGGLVAAETLFIDDTSANLEAAEKLGFHTHLMLAQERIEAFL